MTGEPRALHDPRRQTFRKGEHVNEIQPTICNLYIIEDNSHWHAMIEREGDTNQIGMADTPGQALDVCVKWAKDRGLFPCVDATGFRVIKEDPRARSV